jgi:hypothetical protein
MSWYSLYRAKVTGAIKVNKNTEYQPITSIINKSITKPTQEEKKPTNK